MKRIFTLAILLFAFATSHTFAQQACAWAKRAGGTAEDWGSEVATDASGNVYYLGSFYSQTCVFGTTTLINQPYQYFNYGAEMFLVKYDACGVFQWARQAGGNSETNARGLAVDAAGNIFVTGHTFCDTLFFGTSPIYITNTNYYDVFLAKYDPSGTLQWATQGTGDYHERSYGVTVDPSGAVYLAGYFGSTALRFGTDSVMNSNGNNYYDVFIGKFDNTTGNCQWLRSAKGNNDDDYAYGISTDAAANIYVTGTYGSNYIAFGTDSLPLSAAGYMDVFTVKYDSSGAEQWLRVAGSSNNDQAWSIATDGAGNSYITGFIGDQSTVNFGNGQSINNPKQAYNFFLTKYDANGTAQWARTVGSNWWTTNRGYRVKLDGNGDPNVIGFFNSDSLIFGPLSLLNMSMTGGMMSGGDTAYDAFIVKYKANGNVQWVRNVGGDDHDLGYGIAPGPNYSLYVCGEYRSTSMVVNSTTLTATNKKGNAWIANNINKSSLMATICLVTSDSLSANNVVYWDKTPFAEVDSFLIYREVSTNTYKLIGTQDYSALSQFTDTTRSVGPSNGDPNVGTYRYKLQTLDTAGNLGTMSPYHNTVFFVDNGGGTFTWNTYQVENATTPVVNFNLRRDDIANGNYLTVGTVAGTQTTLNDPAYATYSLTADWRVEATGFNCTATARLGNNTAMGAIVKSKSNITNNRGIGIQEVAGAKVALYPNPAANSVTVAGQKELGTITLMNSIGVVVYQMQSKLMQEQIDLGKLPAGIYILQAQGRFMKLIKE